MGSTHSSEPRIAPADVVLIPPPLEIFKPWHHAFPAIIPATTLKFEMNGNWDMDKAMVVWQTCRHSETQRKSQRREPICKIQMADKGYDIDFVPGVDATLMAIFCIVLNEKLLR